jgi:phospholipid/cholesterol/gamma-HCH transport system substrate-binding protein
MARGAGGLEFKVGLFVVITTLILGAFVLVLGNFRFTPAHQLLVTFSASGGLRDGSKVKVAGVHAGRVKEVRFVGAEPETDDRGNRVWVKVLIEVDRDKASAVTSASRFYITAEGMLGEKYVEIAPGSGDGAPVPSGSVVRGEPVLEMHVATERALEAFSKVEAALGGSTEDLRIIVQQTRGSVESAHRMLTHMEQELPGLLEEARLVVKRGDEVLHQVGELTREGRTWLADPAVRTAVDAASRVMGTFDQRLPALLEHAEGTLKEAHGLVSETRERTGRLEADFTESSAAARRLMARAEGALKTIDTTELMATAKTTLERATGDLAATASSVKDLADRSGRLVGELASLVDGVKRGRGTLGAFLVNREVYDDVRELILDLKRNPWKVLWKP